MSSELQTPILVFDAQCLLCNGWVRFLLRHDRRVVFCFAAIQGATGQALLHQAGLQVEGLQTLLLVDGNRSWQHTSAILQALHHLGWPWRVAWLGGGCARAVARCVVPPDRSQPLPDFRARRHLHGAVARGESPLPGLSRAA